MKRPSNIVKFRLNGFALDALDQNGCAASEGRLIEWACRSRT